MHKPNLGILIAVLFTISLSTGCGMGAPPAPAAIDAGKLQPFAPLPAVMTSATNPIAEEKVALGRMLYRGYNCYSLHQLPRVFSLDVFEK